MSHSSEIRVLRVRPGQAPEQIQIPNTLSAFQQEVGGWIETVPLGDGAILICNEEGKLTGTAIYQHIYDELVRWSATDELFEEKLKGDIYEENVGVARFVLCAIAQKHMTNETWTDLWEQNDYGGKKVFKWTIEHIFPEGKNIPDKWVDMIAAGDRNLANEYLEQYVHKIGNLTVTGYNSTLSNLSFVEKRDRLNAQKLYVGYKNGLEINKELAEKDAWTVQDIIDRTDELVEMLLDMYKL